jgi:putative ABC transport system permease protein
MGDLLKDLGFGFRLLRRTPGFSIVAILTLALGIGAATAVFSVVNVVLLRPLPFAEQERLMVLRDISRQRGSSLIEISYPTYRDWRDQNQVFEQMAALITGTSTVMNLTGEGEPQQVEAEPVSSNFFATLGVKPLLGRTFLPEEDQLGTRGVAVLSGRMWKEQFGGDPNIIGRQLRLDEQGYTVVGVMPVEFRYPQDARLWVPIVPALGERSEQRIYRFLKVVGRLKPGVSLDQARSEMEVVSSRLAALYDPNRSTSPMVMPLAEEIVGDSRPALLTLLVGVLFLLLIAVANVGNLLLVRALERHHEISVRAALGAARGRVIRQLLTEGLALGLLGGAGGLLLAVLGIRLLRAMAPENLPRIDEIGLDPLTLLFALGVSLLAVAIFGTVPALEAGKGDLNQPLREGSKRSAGSVRSSRFSRLLVRSEVALALVLLIGAGLTFQSMLRLQQIDPGFDPHNVLTARIQLPEKTYPDPQKRQMFFEQLSERAAALPGVESAATVLARPLDNSSIWEIPIGREGQTKEEREKNPLANLQAISPGYFQTMRIPLLKGRDFDSHDDEHAPLVAIVSKGLAERFWPGQEAIGKRLRRTFRGPADQTMPWIMVVGVASDVRYHGWEQVKPDLYVPFRQNPIAEYTTHQDLVLRTSVEPLALARPLREAVYSVDPNQAVTSLESLDNLVDHALAGPRFTLQLMATFGLVALCLAVVGIYGLLAYTVGQRSREISIRMALGARKQEIFRMVIGQGLKLTAVGLALGIAAALALTRFMANLLHGVSNVDPFTFISVPLLLASVALLATVVPAVRAARADPNKALRS